MANQLRPEVQWPNTCPLGIDLAMAADTQFKLMWSTQSWRQRERYRIGFREAELVVLAHATHCALCLFSPLRPVPRGVRYVVPPERLDGIEANPVIRAALSRLQGVVVECRTAPPRGRPRREGRVRALDRDPDRGRRVAPLPPEEVDLKPRRRSEQDLDRDSDRLRGGDAGVRGQQRLARPKRPSRPPRGE